MFRLLKYEFRKTGFFLVFMGMILLLTEGAYIYGCMDLQNTNMVIARLPVWMYVIISPTVFFINGILIYARDFNAKNGYLVFMSPLSNKKILASKLLYTLITSAVNMALLIVLCFVNTRLYINQNFNIFESLMYIFRWLNFDITKLISALIGLLIEGILHYLVSLGIAYLVVTFMYCLFKQTKWNKFLSIVLIFILIGITNGIVVAIPLLNLPVNDPFISIMAVEVYQCAYSIVLLVLCWIGCSKILDKKLNL